MAVLADSSVWVEYLRNRDARPVAKLDALLAEDQVVVCGPIVAELLAGVRAKGREELRENLSALRWLPITRATWSRAGDVAHDLGVRGSRAPLVDVMIAAVAASSDTALWTFDQHFQTIAEVLQGYFFSLRLAARLSPPATIIRARIEYRRQERV